MLNHWFFRGFSLHLVWCVVSVRSYFQFDQQHISPFLYVLLECITENLMSWIFVWEEYPQFLVCSGTSPAHVMPLLEIVRAEQTSSQAIQDLIGLAKVIRKVPIVVQSCVGFAVNRIFFPYFQAAGLLVDLGLHPYRIDAIIKDFGMPMGPFRQFLWNLVKCFWILSVKIQWLTFCRIFESSPTDIWHLLAKRVTGAIKDMELKRNVEFLGLHSSNKFLSFSCVIRLADLSGIQIASATSKMYKKAYPERVYLSALSDLLLKDNRLGK